MSGANYLDEWIDSSDFDSEGVTLALLELLSAAVSDKAIRKSVALDCVDWLNKFLKSSNPKFTFIHF